MVPAEGPVKRDTGIVAAMGRIARRILPANFPHGLIMHEVKKVSSRTNAYPVTKAAIPTQENSAGINQDGTDYSYFAEVYLGTRIKPYQMLLDTGAGQSWVMGTSCTTRACKLHDTFGPTDSTTYKEVSNEFFIGYGTGNVTGTQVQDSVTLAGLKLSMTFGVASETSKDFENFPIDGILGLSQMTAEHPNFIQSLATSKLLKSNIFGVSINRASDGANTGEINFGAPNTAKFNGDLKYSSVSANAEKDWALPFESAGFGTKKSDVPSRLAYLDTGTSFIFASPADVKIFYSQITGAKSADSITYTVPCDTTDSLFFTFSGVSYTVSTKDWVGPNINGVCTSNVYGIEVIPGAWLLGDTFLKNVYAVFDIDQSRVGELLSQEYIKARANFVAGLAQNSKPSVTSTTSSSIPTGGPKTSLTSTSSSSSTSISASIPGPTSTTSNGISTGSSTSMITSPSASETATTGSSVSGSPAPGLNGHETSPSAANETPAGSTAVPASSTSAPPASLGSRLDINELATLFAAVLFIASIT